MPRSILIVGASGILAPAAEILIGRGDRVTGITRGRREVPAGAESLDVDARIPDDLRKSLNERRWGAAIIYAPAITDESFPVLRDVIDGRLVVVRVSAAADPALGPLVIPADVLQLGWRAGQSSERWHSPYEISDAALDVLEDGIGRVLGIVRPWEDRP